MIPKVKTWIIKMENGQKHEVLAPTKFLAKLNFRADVNNWGPIKSIEVKRKK